VGLPKGVDYFLITYCREILVPLADGEEIIGDMKTDDCIGFGS